MGKLFKKKKSGMHMMEGDYMMSDREMEKMRGKKMMKRKK